MNWRRIIFSAAVLAGVGALTGSGAFAAAGPPAGGIDEGIVCQDKVAVLIQDYEQQIVITQKAVDDLKADLKWLKLKIHEMENMDQAVPQKMKDAVAYRTMRINVLEEQRQKYAAYLLALRQMKDNRYAGNKNLAGVTLEELEAGIRAAQLVSWLDLAKDRDTGTFIATTALPILFSSGSTKIAPTYMAFLKKLAGLLKGYPVRILVKGHTDPDPIKTRKFPSNFELGAARAANVVHALVKHGVKPSVFKISSTGEYRMGKHLPTRSKKALERNVNLEIRFP